jgi:hypothetical protein
MGTVTDQSVGAKDTPAISDANMTDWMQYLYMQKPQPTNAAGVPVTLSVFDPNNNTYVIGTTTSDSNGNFGFMWQPPVPGMYKVMATFGGSNSYWGSTASNYFSVEKTASASVNTNTAQTTSPSVPSSPSTSPSPTQPPATTPITPVGEYPIAAITVIAVIAIAAAALFLKKRAK